MVKNDVMQEIPVMQETWIRSLSLGWQDPLKKGMAIHSSILFFFFFHSSILAWRILWAEEPGGVQSMGLQRVRHD